MEWSVATVGWLVGGGFLAGLVNTLAGAGSLINLPLLASVGLPHLLANATNRVAVLVQTGAAVASFRRSGHLPWETTRGLLVPTLLGSAVGAFVATLLPERIFRPIVGAELLALAWLLLRHPDLWLHPAPGGRRLSRGARHLVFFAIGVYAGFIQAAVGFLLVAALVRLLGLDLIRANAAKAILTATATLLALAIFLAAEMVDWAPALVLAAGNGLGGWVGARLAVRKGAGWIRWFLVATAVLAGLEFAGLFDLVADLLRRA